MFTIPAAGGSGIILVARPSASSGTITNATNAYDLPSSRADDPPYTTSADRATVTGSAVAGTPDYDVVEYNTFPSKSKANFSQCQLVVGISASLSSICVSSVRTGPTSYNNEYVTANLTIDYQIDGLSWVTIRNFVTYDGFDNNLGSSANSFIASSSIADTPGAASSSVYTKQTISALIPASSFPSNLNSLKVRIRLGTCKNNVTTTYQSSGSYNIWDIRANIS